jgi:hypothetical protein
MAFDHVHAFAPPEIRLLLRRHLARQKGAKLQRHPLGSQKLPGRAINSPSRCDRSSISGIAILWSSPAIVIMLDECVKSLTPMG